MAEREVFFVNQDNNFVKEQVNFEWYRSSDKAVRKQNSVKNLHKAFLEYSPQTNILEVSSASMNEIGKASSAFNLQILTSQGKFSVENLFQASKNFANSGNHEELLNGSSLEAKQGIRKYSKHDKLVSFKLFGKTYPITPQTLFYNFLYCNALWQNPEIAMQIVKFDAFTDINFNDQYGINCQAESCSIFTSLCRKRQLKKALSSFNDFRKIVYGTSI